MEECFVVEYIWDVVLGVYNKIVWGFKNLNDMLCSMEKGFICKLGIIIDLFVKVFLDSLY